MVALRGLGAGGPDHDRQRPPHRPEDHYEPEGASPGSPSTSNSTPSILSPSTAATRRPSPGPSSRWKSASRDQEGRARATATRPPPPRRSGCPQRRRVLRRGDEPGLTTSLPGNPRTDVASAHHFNDGARRLWVPPEELERALTALQRHENSGRPREKDHPLTRRDIRLDESAPPAYLPTPTIAWTPRHGSARRRCGQWMRRFWRPCGPTRTSGPGREPG